MESPLFMEEYRHEQTSKTPPHSIAEWGCGARQSEQGLSTIEVIAALLLFSIALLPIAQVQINAQRGSIIVNEAETKARLEQQALIYMKSVNVAVRPTGEHSFGDGSIRWTSELVVPNAQIRLNERTIGFYNVQVELRKEERILSSRKLQITGWN